MKSRNWYRTVTTTLLFSGELLAVLNHSPAAHGAEPGAVPAEFRGCESMRSCRFQIESSTASIKSLLVVRPNGVSTGRGEDATAIAVRDRLNFLMSNMIHQHKRIELQEMRELDDGTYAATVKVNGTDVSADPILNSLMETSRN